MISLMMFGRKRHHFVSSWINFKREIAVWRLGNNLISSVCSQRRANANNDQESPLLHWLSVNAINETRWFIFSTITVTHPSILGRISGAFTFNLGFLSEGSRQFITIDWSLLIIMHNLKPKEKFTSLFCAETQFAFRETSRDFTAKSWS